jgi:hypothetical protein
MYRTSFDLATGEQTHIPLTEVEIAALQNASQSTPFARMIDARRLRLALHQLDLLEIVESAIATLSKSAQIDWEYATEIKEDYPLVISLSTELGLNVSEIFDIAIAIK